jgi:hypothetical protein
MPRPKFRSLAASGEFVRIPYGERSYRYYAYDLLDWALAKRAVWPLIWPQLTVTEAYSTELHQAKMLRSIPKFPAKPL